MLPLSPSPRLLSALPAFLLDDHRRVASFRATVRELDHPIEDVLLREVDCLARSQVPAHLWIIRQLPLQSIGRPGVHGNPHVLVALARGWEAIFDEQRLARAQTRLEAAFHAWQF